jgi:hypothetical protein
MLFEERIGMVTVTNIAYNSNDAIHSMQHVTLKMLRFGLSSI